MQKQKVFEKLVWKSICISTSIISLLFLTNRIPETLPEEVLKKMYAAPKPDVPVATPTTLTEYDYFLFGTSCLDFINSGIPTRFGNFPAQWKAFWDSTGGLWGKQALAGKMFGTFVSTGTPGGGQELTAFQSLSVSIHHGMVFIPIGYQIPELTNLDEVHGGSPWGIKFWRFM
jgi:NAD(P)H dehydrogenase (quinone)